MFRSDLIREVAEKSGIDQETVKTVLLAEHQAIQDNLIKGIDVKIKEFANFTLHIRKGGEVHNPLVGKKVKVPKRYYVKTVWPRPFIDRLKNKPVY